MKRHTQNGVALITTLIMLSLVTFMSVAFLALSRRERASVTVHLDQVQSKMVADIALARAQSEVVARMIATSNRWDYGLLVSTNYIRLAGFKVGDSGLDNVNYDTTTVPGPLSIGDLITNVNNLYYDPRPPVYIDTNYNNVTGPLEARFYLDFNRNGLFDITGWVDNQGLTNQTESTNWVVGDPQWIGVLEKPGVDANGVAYRHSGENRFIGRYAYLVLPEGKSLDLNYLHNQAKYRGTNDEGFVRNQGFGNWEMNLAAFLTDLNTNAWLPPSDPGGYLYDRQVSANPTNYLFASQGVGFNDDALQLTRYRYNGNYFNLAAVTNLNSLAGVDYPADLIDGYGNGPLMTGLRLLSGTAQEDDPAYPWFGSPPPHPYFDVRQLFDTSQAYSNFTARLQGRSAIGTNIYDRYTFYRMLAQMGVDSAPPAPRRVHLNYVNYTNFAGAAIANYQTNFNLWTITNAADFFTLVADQLLKQTFNNAVSLTDSTRPITVYSATNASLRYRGDVHRYLQLAANIYDAAQTNLYPTVFRPQFMTNDNDIFISGYVAEDSTNFLYTNSWISLPTVSGAQPTNVVNITNANIYGIPLVIGAKKGYPNFNEFTVETVMQLTRKLEIYKNTNTVPATYYTNQMLIMGVTNIVANEAWNSYTSAYTRPFQVFLTNYYSAGMTNDLGATLLSQPVTNIIRRPPSSTYNSWQAAASFMAATNQALLTNNIFNVSGVPSYWLPLYPYQYARPPTNFPVPTWYLNITNRVVYGMIDTNSGRLMDFVSLDNLVTSIDVSQQLVGNGTSANEPAVIANLWLTNRIGGATNTAVPTLGVVNQMLVSLGQPRLPQNYWTAFSSSGPASPDREINKFRVFMGQTPFQPLTPAEARLVRFATNMAAPFAPTRKVYHIQRWGANDPLVHYTLEDLVHPVQDVNPATVPISPPSQSYAAISKASYYFPPGSSQAIGRPIDQRIFTPYSPWGGKRAPNGNPVSTNAFDYDLSLKDPLVRWSDDWDFPTNKFGSIGWLGRVHRGTPWQTVYFKALTANLTLWSQWIGYTNSLSNPLAVHPTNDWFLANLFTVAPCDEAARGLLSLNQTNLAAWSAALGGVLVLSNTVDYSLSPPSTAAAFADLDIQPATDQLRTIYYGIDAARASLNNQVPVGAFTNVGQLLMVPELSVGQPLGTTNVDDIPTIFSPYLRPGIIGSVYTDEMKYGLNDVAYERIPQQILSLVTLEEIPRIVVYAFGQSLKPAERSIVLAPGPTRGLCTNYQITGEVATRTVLRIEGMDKTPPQPRAVVEAYNVLTSD